MKATCGESTQVVMVIVRVIMVIVRVVMVIVRVVMVIVRVVMVTVRVVVVDSYKVLDKLIRGLLVTLIIIKKARIKT